MGHASRFPLGVTETILENWLIGGMGYLTLPGLFKSTDSMRLALSYSRGFFSPMVKSPACYSFFGHELVNVTFVTCMCD